MMLLILSEMAAVLRIDCFGVVVVADNVSHGRGCPRFNMLFFSLNFARTGPDNLSALTFSQGLNCLTSVVSKNVHALQTFAHLYEEWSPGYDD